MMTTPFHVRVLTAIRRQYLVVLCILIVGGSGAAYAAARNHVTYTATATVLMVAEPPDSSNRLIPTTATKPLLSTDLPSLATDATVLRRLRNDLHESVQAESLKVRIHAKIGTDSTIMPVTYTAQTPSLAIYGSNALADEITRFYRDTATTRFDSLIADFRAQLATRRAQLNKLDSEVAATAKTYPYIDIKVAGSQNTEATSVYGRLIALHASRDELQATMLADGAAAQITRRLIADAKPLAERDVLNNDSAYRSVRDQLARDFASLKRMNAFGSDRYPGVAEMRAIVARETRMVATARKQAIGAGPGSNVTYVAALDSQAKADSLYVGDATRYKALNAQIASLQSQIGAGSISTAAASLRRDHDVAEDAYATIANRLAKAIADRAEAASTGSVIVLDHAQFASRAAFGGGTVIAVGILFLTLWSAVSLAMLIDANSSWFSDARTVETIYGAKLLGSLS